MANQGYPAMSFLVLLFFLITIIGINTGAEAENVKKKYNLVKSQIKLDQLKLKEMNLQKDTYVPICDVRLDDFSESVATFEYCALREQATPGTVCIQCLFVYYNMNDSYTAMIEPISIPDVEANTCAELYSDKTSFNLFQKKVDEHLGKNSVWAQMACDNCYVNQTTDLGLLRPEVKSFLKTADEIDACFDSISNKTNGSLSYEKVPDQRDCLKCADKFWSWSEDYHNKLGVFRDANASRACNDIRERYNVTINAWNNELQCPTYWHPTYAVYQFIFFTFLWIFPLLISLIIHCTGKCTCFVRWFGQDIPEYNLVVASRAEENYRIIQERHAERMPNKGKGKKSRKRIQDNIDFQDD